MWHMKIEAGPSLWRSHIGEMVRRRVYQYSATQVVGRQYKRNYQNGVIS